MIGEKLTAVAVLAALVTGAVGCATSGPDVAGPTASRPPESSSGGAMQAGTASADAAPLLVPATAAPSESLPSASSSPVAMPAADVYLAEGQDVRGPLVRAPACAAGCPLSGDGTIVLYDMTWREWTRTEAVGTGTEEIQGCVPDCAAGPQYKVAVTVTLAAPKRDCVTPGASVYLWTKAAFRWPDGLPSRLQGPNAPYNPWPFTALKAQLGCG